MYIQIIYYILFYYFLANNGAFMKNRHGKKADQHDRSHFYPVTKEPTTPSQDAPRKRKTRHSQNPPQVK